jgi:carbon-monoxide dehydrogenase medium subunit
MKSFDYLEAQDLDEAISFLNKHAPDVKPMAGGTDLYIEYLHHSPVPNTIVGITDIEEIQGIEENEDFVCIGSATSLHSIAKSNLLIGRFEMLSESAALVGSRQIRNLATVGGNICNAVPSADTAPPLLCADAQVVIQGPNGRRDVAISDFFLGVRQTVLEPDELVVEFLLPTDDANRRGSAYLRHTPRKALDLAMVGVAVSLSINSADQIHDVSIALGAVAPTPYRVFEAERLLDEAELSDPLVDEVAEVAAASAKPISDVRGSAEFRLDMIRELTRRCLSLAHQRASGEAH